jgi:hypothetical protein
MRAKSTPPPAMSPPTIQKVVLAPGTASRAAATRNATPMTVSTTAVNIIAMAVNRLDCMRRS